MRIINRTMTGLMALLCFLAVLPLLFIFGEVRMGYLWIFPKAAHLSVGIGALRPRPGELQAVLRRVMARYGLDLSGIPRSATIPLLSILFAIGVLGIPAVLLTKPSPLTDEERELIATHPELSTRIGAPIERLEDVRPIVRARHERFDGRGYPDGLCADEIPIEARILHACDAFHTLTTVRPYRARLPVEEARRRLAEGAGTQFDPRVVEVCLRLLETPGAGTVSAVTESL